MNEIIENFVLNSNCNIKETAFWNRVNFNKYKNSQLVLLCYNQGKGYEPHKILIEHQIYIKDLEKILKDKPEIEGFSVFALENNLDFLNKKENGLK